MCATYDETFRRMKEAIRRGDTPSGDLMALIERWLLASEAKKNVTASVAAPSKVPTAQDELLTEVRKLREDFNSWRNRPQ